MYTFFMKAKFAALMFITLALAACTGGDTQDLRREDLFTLDYGKMEDELDLIQYPGKPFDTGTRLVMQNGFFYILNRTSGKLMKFNSYGDILELYYNKNLNPEPVLLKDSSAEGTRATRRAFSYPFQDIRNFAVSTDETVLVDDRVPESRREYDDEIEALLDRIVLRFDRDGRLIDYLGQEGVGGTPFSFIDRIDVNSRGEIIITTRNMKSWRVYWYTAGGRSLSTVDIPVSTLPVPKDGDYSVSLESVMPDRAARTIYLKVDYYGEESDSEQNRGYGYISSAILVLQAETGLYSDTVHIPVHYQDAGEPAGFSEDRRKMLYEFLGVTENRFFFLMSPEGGAYYRLLVLDRSGAVQSRVRIELAENPLYYRYMYVDPQGILSALLCLENNVEVIWWRSDQLIPGAGE